MQDDADLFSVGAHEADLGNADPVVRSGIADAMFLSSCDCAV